MKRQKKTKLTVRALDTLWLTTIRRKDNKVHSYNCMSLIFYLNTLA